MRGVAGEQRTGALTREGRAREPRRRAKRLQTEAAHVHWVPRHLRAGKRSFDQLVGRCDERAQQTAPCLAVGAEAGRGVLERALEHDRRAVVERVREGRRRLDPLDPVLDERHGAEERRRDPERVDRRAGVVVEARERQLLGAHAAADGVPCLEHEHRAAGAREHDRRREPVRPRTDDDRVVHSRDATATYRASSCGASSGSRLNASRSSPATTGASCRHRSRSS